MSKKEREGEGVKERKTEVRRGEVRDSTGEKERSRKEGDKKVGRGSGFKKKRLKVAGLVIALVAVLAGGVLFVGAASGWFSEFKVRLSEEYYCTNNGSECDGSLTELSVEEYKKLAEEKKSFVVLVDKGACKTADRLKEFLGEFSRENGMRFYKMDFLDMKETDMYEKIKYNPSVAIISQGKVARFLRADSDEDSGMYNRYEEFKGWMERSLELPVEKGENKQR